MDENNKESSEQDSKHGVLGETVKKLFMAGLSAAFMTEEHIRSYVGELKLPKEVLNTLLQGAAKSKEELVGRLGKEFVNILKKIDFVKEASKFAEEHKFKIHAEVEVVRKNKNEDEENL